MGLHPPNMKITPLGEVLAMTFLQFVSARTYISKLAVDLGWISLSGCFPARARRTSHEWCSLSSWRGDTVQWITFVSRPCEANLEWLEVLSDEDCTHWELNPAELPESLGGFTRSGNCEEHVKNVSFGCTQELPYKIHSLFLLNWKGGLIYG